MPEDSGWTALTNSEVSSGGDTDREEVNNMTQLTPKAIARKRRRSSHTGEAARKRTKLVVPQAPAAALAFATRRNDLGTGLDKSRSLAVNPSSPFAFLTAGSSASGPKFSISHTPSRGPAKEDFIVISSDDDTPPPIRKVSKMTTNLMSANTAAKENIRKQDAPSKDDSSVTASNGKGKQTVTISPSKRRQTMSSVANNHDSNHSKVGALVIPPFNRKTTPKKALPQPKAKAKANGIALGLGKTVDDAISIDSDDDDPTLDVPSIPIISIPVLAPTPTLTNVPPLTPITASIPKPSNSQAPPGHKTINIPAPNHNQSGLATSIRHEKASPASLNPSLTNPRPPSTNLLPPIQTPTIKPVTTASPRPTPSLSLTPIVPVRPSIPSSDLSKTPRSGSSGPGHKIAGKGKGKAQQESFDVSATRNSSHDTTIDPHNRRSPDTGKAKTHKAPMESREQAAAEMKIASHAVASPGTKNADLTHPLAPASSTSSDPDIRGSSETSRDDEDGDVSMDDGSTNFQCTECDMSFDRKDHKRRHMRIHSEERLFTCHCGKAHYRRDKLRQHLKSRHSDMPEQNEELMKQLDGAASTKLRTRSALESLSADLGNDLPRIPNTQPLRSETSKEPERAVLVKLPPIPAKLPVRRRPVMIPRKSTGANFHRKAIARELAPKMTVTPKSSSPPIVAPASRKAEKDSRNALSHPVISADSQGPLILPAPSAKNPPRGESVAGPSRPPLQTLEENKKQRALEKQQQQTRDIEDFIKACALRLPSKIQDHINNLPSTMQRDPGFREVFEAMMRHNTAEDEPRAPPITLVNNVDDEPCPPWEFYYTNKMIYGHGVPPPRYDALVGCDCVGACDPKSKTCSCVQRHRRHSTEDVHYTKDGTIQWEDTPIFFECNAACECSEECLMRTIQRGRKVMLSIQKTRKKGWGVFAKQNIPPGSYIGIYSGELLTDIEAEHRGHVYNDFGRTYLFDLDFDHLKDGTGPAAMIPTLAAPGALYASEGDRSSPPSLERSASGNAAAKRRRATYTVDAFHVGNHTRFFNHSCEANMFLASVYINDPDIEKPMMAFFTHKLVANGEELTFNYKGSGADEDDGDSAAVDEDEDDEDEEDDSGEDEEDDRTDSVFAPCYCGAKSCSGSMFNQRSTKPKKKRKSDPKGKYTKGRRRQAR